MNQISIDVVNEFVSYSFKTNRNCQNECWTFYEFLHGVRKKVDDE